MNSESDTRAKLIDPALHQSGWSEDSIRREETAGAIDIVAGQPKKRAGRADYILRVKISDDTRPIRIAVIEAKAENLPPNHGLQQAKDYGSHKRLNVPFVFSSNGHQFVEFDAFSGLTSNAKPMSEFPSPEALRTRYEAGKGISLSSEIARPLITRHTGSDASLRYYQEAAVQAVFEKIASGGNRALLTLATGTGKTLRIWLIQGAKKRRFISTNDFYSSKYYDRAVKSLPIDFINSIDTGTLIILESETPFRSVITPPAPETNVVDEPYRLANDDDRFGGS